MYTLDLEQTKEKIVSSGKLSPEDLNKKIQDKVAELSNLISEEGAAHIIANELGVDLESDSSEKEIKIKEINPSLSSVSFNARVIVKYPKRNFNSNGKEGSVLSVLVGDDTGKIRLVFWNDQTDHAEKFDEGDILQIKNGLVRKNRDLAEVHFNDRSNLELNPSGVSLPEFKPQSISVSSISSESDNVEINGTITQLYDPKFFYVDPETNRRVEPGQTSVIPKLNYVMNAVVDDGTGNIRCTFWKNQSDRLCGLPNLDQYEHESFDNVKNSLLGVQVKLIGKIKRNEMYDRYEFIVNLVEKNSNEEEVL